MVLYSPGHGFEGITGVRHRQDKADEIPGTNVNKKGKILVFLGAISVVALYVSAIWFPTFLLIVLVSILLIWAYMTPRGAFLLLFPCIVPFTNLEIPGLPGITLMRFFLIGVLIASLPRIKQYFPLFWNIPKYALVGIGWLLVAEVISGFFLSPASNAMIAVMVRITRTVTFLLAAAFASQEGGLSKAMWGWIFFGVLQVFSATVLQLGYGSVMAARRMVGFELGSFDTVAAMAVAFGYMAVATFWFAVAKALRKRGITKFILWGFAVLSLAASFYSGRRQALLALVLSALLAGVVMKGRRKLAMIGALCIVFIGLYYGGPLREFIENRQSLADELRLDSQAQYMPMHIAGIKAFLESPILGIGLGNYRAATAAEGVIGTTGDWASSHSSVVRILTETGLLGAVGLAILSYGFALAMIRVIRSLRASPMITTMHLVFPSIGLVLTGYAITLLDHFGYVFFFGQIVGLMSYYLKKTGKRVGSK